MLRTHTPTPRQPEAFDLLMAARSLMRVKDFLKFASQSLRVKSS